VARARSEVSGHDPRLALEDENAKSVFSIVYIPRRPHFYSSPCQLAGDLGLVPELLGAAKRLVESEGMWAIAGGMRRGKDGARPRDGDRAPEILPG
jgi:hypothetical protein